MSAQAHAASFSVPVGDVDIRPETLVLHNVKIDVATPAEHISVFDDDRWYLYPMAQKPTSRRYPISFASSPPAFQETLKRLVWCMINLPTPVDMLQRPTAIRNRLTPGSINTIIDTGMRPLTRWLEKQGIIRLRDADDAVLRAYGEYVAALSITRERKAQQLWGVTRIWLSSVYLPAEDRIAQPPWEPDGIEDLLGPADWRPENKTQPIHPQTMSGLLVWALRFVHDVSDDIIRANERYKEMTAERSHRYARPSDIAKRDRYLANLRRDGQPLPGVISNTGRLALARKYIAAKLDVPYGILNSIKPGEIPVRAGAPIDTPIRGQIDGEPWTSYIDFYEVDHIVRLLAGACLVVVAYLSGMRNEECLALRRGCCRRTGPDGDTTGGFEIISKTFKSALDKDGNTILGGVVRAHPWYVIGPVNAAISVMERLHPHDLLFPTSVLNATGGKPHHAPNHQVTARLIDELIAWCNENAVRLGRPDEVIPPDPEGPVTMRRFRRTLAWHIYRLPAGRISLGIQYGHLYGRVSDGYGSRASVGLRDVFPMEEALARSDRLSDAADRLHAGERVSGPAKRPIPCGGGRVRSRIQGLLACPKRVSATPQESKAADLRQRSSGACLLL